MRKVSVIMNSVGNDETVLKEAINSYRMQKGVDVEIIVSTIEGDCAVDVANSLGCIVVTGKKAHIFEQINRAIKKVTGDYVCYASGNDTAIQGKLELESGLLEKNNKLVCYSAFQSVNAETGVLKTRKFHDYDFKKHLQGNFVSDCSMMKREVLDKYGPFQTKHKNHAYYDFWLRVAEGEGSEMFIYNDTPTWIYKFSGDSQHIKRKSDPEAKKKNEEARAKMLSYHQ